MILDLATWQDLWVLLLQSCSLCNYKIDEPVDVDSVFKCLAFNFFLSR